MPEVRQNMIGFPSAQVPPYLALPFPLDAIEEISQRYFISGLLRVEGWLRCTPSHILLHCQQFEDIRAQPFLIHSSNDTVFPLTSSEWNEEKLSNGRQIIFDTEISNNSQSISILTTS